MIVTHKIVSIELNYYLFQGLTEEDSEEDGFAVEPTNMVTQQIQYKLNKFLSSTIKIQHT
jgi:hypothetical protein